MGKFRAFEEPPSKGPHRDYESNLNSARAFCAKVRPDLPQGMRVEIAGSHNLNESLLMFSWNPGRHTPMGNYATPVSLHQARDDVQKQIKEMYTYFILKIHKFHERTNSQYVNAHG